jgi:hypothetical protein
MHDITMDVKEFDSDEAAKKAGYNIPLTKPEFGLLSEMNRAQRRQWLKDQRKSGYTSSPKGKA